MAKTFASLQAFPSSLLPRERSRAQIPFPFPFERLPRKLLGTLRSKEADGNANVKETIGLISKTTTSQVHHVFLYISFPFLHDYDVKMPNFVFYGERTQATAKF